MKSPNAFYINGMLALLLTTLIIGGAWIGVSYEMYPIDVAIGITIFFPFVYFMGLRVIGPNTSAIVLRLGKYSGTLYETGFIWIIPIFYWTRFVSLKINSLESEKIKVNDKSGNPIIIGSIVAWKVKDPYKAAFSVEKYDEFVRIQTDAAVRKIASEYTYDTFNGDGAITLSSGGERLNTELVKEVEERVQHAGIEIIEARIGHLSYAPEIAQAMLKRQQAEATISARSKIVEGAVSMVDMALLRLSEQKVVDLKPDDKARMAINLLTVLCSENVQPTIQTNPNT